VSKEKILEILIPEPCTENWEAMQPKGCGRFCVQCSKTVIDFTDVPDEALVRFFTQKQEDICGRFREDQLNRKIPFIETREHTHFRRRLSRIAASMLLAQASVTNLQAQEKQAQQIILNGNVRDYLDNTPLIGMVISIDGLGYQKYSDKNGQFSFVLPASFANKKVIVKATYQASSSAPKTGYLIREAQAIPAADSQHMTVQLQRYPFQQLDTVHIEARPVTIIRTSYAGGISATVQPKMIKAPLWYRVKRIFKKKKH
jgi:hypothetical protein